MKDLFKIISESGGVLLEIYEDGCLGNDEYISSMSVTCLIQKVI